MSETTDVTVDMLVTTTIHTDTMNILNVLMPDWVQGVADKYANEYSELTNTWDQLCKKVGAEKKAKILIVSYLPMKLENDNDKYIGMIADILVSKGYLLRRSTELMICEKTGEALVTKKMFDYFKRHNNVFPKEWSATAARANQSESDAESRLRLLGGDGNSSV